MTLKINWELRKQNKEIGIIEGSKLIKQLREESDLTLKEVGAIIGISFQYISQVEQGVKAPADQLIECLAKCYNIDADAIFKAYNRVPTRASNFLEDNTELQIAISKLALRDDKDDIIKQLVSMVE